MGAGPEINLVARHSLSRRPYSLPLIPSKSRIPLGAFSSGTPAAIPSDSPALAGSGGMATCNL